MQQHIINYNELRDFVAPHLDALEPQYRALTWRRILRYVGQTPAFHQPLTARELASFKPPVDGQPVIKIRLDEQANKAIAIPVRYLIWANRAARNLTQKTIKQSFTDFSRVATKWWNDSFDAEVERGEIHPVAHYGDYAFVRLLSEDAFRRHGQKAQNCIGREDIMFTDYFGEHLACDLSVFVLVHKPTNDHHASIVIDTPLGQRPSLREITGKQNLSAASQYVPLIRDFIIKLYGKDVKAASDAELSIGRLTIDGITCNLLDGDTLPSHAKSSLAIRRSVFPIQLPSPFTFGTQAAFDRHLANGVARVNYEIQKFDPYGNFLAAHEARALLERRDWLVRFEMDYEKEFPPIPTIYPPRAAISDAHNIGLPEKITFNGSADFRMTHAKNWPLEMTVLADLNAAESNMTIWRAQYKVYGLANLKGSSLEYIEPESQFSGHADLSDTPVHDFPDDFVGLGRITAHNTPNIRHLSRNNTFQNDVDLTGGGLREVDSGADIGGDFIVDNTKDFRISPPGLTVDFDYFARNSNLEQIGEFTYVGSRLLLGGSRVTRLSANFYVGEYIEGPDGKEWDTAGLSGIGFSSLIRKYNEHYKDWQQQPFAPADQKPKPKSPFFGL